MKLHRYLLACGIVLSLISNIATAAPTDASEDKAFKKFTKSFCVADKKEEEKIFIVNNAFFGTKEQPKVLSCGKEGEYKLYAFEAKDDPGHNVYCVDLEKSKPHSGKPFDCDGKADMGMKTFGLNCFPESQEVTQHRK